MTPLFSKFGLILLLVLASAAVTTSLLGIVGTRYFFLQRSQLRLHPINLDVFAAANKVLQRSGLPRLVIFGDSRALQLPVSALQGRFQVVNRAISGESVAQMESRFQQDVLDLKPDVVVIFAGINDLTAAAALPDQSSRTVDAISGSLQSFAQRAADQGAAVVLLTIVRPAKVRLIRWLVWNKRVYGLVDETNERLRQIEGLHIVLLDADAALAQGAPYLPSRFAADEVHLNEKANHILSQALDAALKAKSP